MIDPQCGTCHHFWLRQGDCTGAAKVCEDYNIDRKDNPVKDKRTEQQILADIRKELLGLEQRALTAKQVEGAIWKLWGFVRDNQNSLDSERCCRMIQEVVSGAVVAVTDRAAALAIELDAAQKELRDSKKEVKRLTGELEKSCEEAASLKIQVSKAQSDVEDLQAKLAEKKPQDDTEKPKSSKWFLKEGQPE